MTTLLPRTSLADAAAFTGPAAPCGPAVAGAVDAADTSSVARFGLRSPSVLPLEGTLDYGTAVLVRLPLEAAARFLPNGLEPIRRGKWALATVVAGRLRDLRPEGMACGAHPAAPVASMGVLSLRIATQIFTRSGEAVRGAYVIHTHAGADLSALLGAGSHALRMRTGKLNLHGPEGSPSERTGGRRTWRLTETRCGRAESLVDVNATHPVRPRGSCFATLTDARAFLMESIAAPFMSMRDGQAQRLHWQPSPGSIANLKPTLMTVERLRLAALDRIVGVNGPAPFHELSDAAWSVEIAVGFDALPMHWHQLSPLTPLDGGPLQDTPMPVRLLG